MMNVGQHSIPEACGFGVNTGFVLPTSIRATNKAIYLKKT